MIGSVPMALDEVPLAPAIISGMVKKKGYDFKFIDINLELFKKCGQNVDLYQTKTQILQEFKDIYDDEIVQEWHDQILDEISGCKYLIVNVFSHFSQATAYRFIKQVKQLYPSIKIFVGGIGSQKKISHTNNALHYQWITKSLHINDSRIFGEVLLNNGLIDSWQADQTASEIENKIPTYINLHASPALDFSIYDLHSYQWSRGNKVIPMLGSYGCVRQCSFCDVLTHFPKYSFIEADQLTKSIVEAYKQTGISKIGFMDSLINGSMSNFLSLLKNLKQSKDNGWLPDNFSWSATYICRPRSTLLDQIHELLPQSGVDNLVIGVESGSDRIRFEMQKKFTNTDLLYELDVFRQQQIKSTLLFFPAWPTETLEDFEETIKLFHNLAPLAQQGTVDTISLGTNGFVLLDGTPIDRDKDKIGLTAGPAPFLWTCTSNLDLNFWESIRRRFVLADICENLGIRLSNENMFRSYLNFILTQHKSLIKEYAGPLKFEIFENDLNSISLLKMTVINSGDKNVTVSLYHNFHNLGQFLCSPGSTDVSWYLETNIKEINKFRLEVRFDKNHKTNWQQYENKDYYDANGIYLDNIYLDHKNITLWGWNQLVSQQLVNPTTLPDDYNKHMNNRAVTQDTNLSWKVEPGRSLQKNLLETLEPEEHQQRKNINRKLLKNLKEFM